MCHPPWRSRNDNEEEGQDEDDEGRSRRDDEMRRMLDVRAVQNMFYSSESTDDDDSTVETSPRLGEYGIYHNLPLWRKRLAITELPGRSLLGFVNDPSNTHMFETLLRSKPESGPANEDKKSMYFGQLRLDTEDGVNADAASPTSTTSQATEMNAPLHSWKDRINDDNVVVIGTLMRINDHIRLDDGRLMLLLHAIERFVVVRPKRRLPYPVADVMILPDEDELSIVSDPEGLGLAVDDSLRRWKEYEYDNSIRFPIERDGADDSRIMPLSEVLSAGGGDVLGSLMPFAPYASHDVKEEGSFAIYNDSRQTVIDGIENEFVLPTFSELVEGGVIREVNSFLLQTANNAKGIPSADEIERDLWILIDEYVHLKGVVNVFPKHLLSLLPRGDIVWPEAFTLHNLASVYSGIALSDKESGMSGSVEPFARVADRTDYPNQRRQKRLSYACTALLVGHGPIKKHPLLNRSMRRTLLEIPSTRGRLWAARELFEAYNSQFRES